MDNNKHKELTRFSISLAETNSALSSSNIFLLSQNKKQRIVIFFIILLEIFSTIIKFFNY